MDWSSEIDATKFISRLEPLIERHINGFERRYGYPPGQNKIVRAAGRGGGRALMEQEFGRGVVPQDLLEFVDQIDSIALPDFWNGYFLGPVSWAVGVHRTGEPRQILLSPRVADVVMLGSDGGAPCTVSCRPKGTLSITCRRD
jgi:hypothetical protein